MSGLPSGAPGNLTPEEEQKLKHAWIHILRLGEHGILEETGSPPDLTSDLRRHLRDPSPAGFRRIFWGSIQAEHPDGVMLRFLRARKWDVAQATAMFVSAVDWRAGRDLAGTIIRAGESVGLKADPTADETGFMAQYRSGKSFVHAADREGRLVYVVRVRLHDPRAQSGEAMETYVLHTFESLRMLATGPEDKFCLLFDLTGFGLANMDFRLVRFLVSVFEARYPETLGAVLVHNAPFVFWGIWNIVKGWLDPVIASKIHFTKKPADLLPFVAAENLQTRYGGEDPWEYAYVEPVAGENARLDDIETRARIEREREGIVREFELETLAWATGRGDAARRSDVALRLRENYRRLDPYVRARTLYHRMGLVKDA
ncbi:CRAL-TRIO domain-containing protein [Xylaria intraflava]|nr:CRAL-TRIO domain-containing protein [Xylaria intraflava]